MLFLTWPHGWLKYLFKCLAIYKKYILKAFWNSFKQTDGTDECIFCSCLRMNELCPYQFPYWLLLSLCYSLGRKWCDIFLISARLHSQWWKLFHHKCWYCLNKLVVDMLWNNNMIFVVVVAFVLVLVIIQKPILVDPIKVKHFTFISTHTSERNLYSRSHTTQISNVPPMDCPQEPVTAEETGKHHHVWGSLHQI